MGYWVLGTGEEEQGEEEGVCLVLCFGAALFVLPSLLSVFTVFSLVSLAFGFPDKEKDPEGEKVRNMFC